MNRKSQAVVRLVRGETLEGVSRDLGVTAAKLSEWRDEFLRGAQAGLRSRPSDDRAEEVKGLQAKIGELMMKNELLEEKIGRLETGRPWVHRRSQR